MSHVYAPNGTAVVPAVAGQALKAIKSSTDATPIVVEFLAAHGLTTGANNGDTVEVIGHQTNSNANGLWAITVVDATHVSLNGSVGNGAGAGSATGAMVDYQLGPQLTIPDDGDADDALNINTPTENIANVSPYLYRATGKYHLVDVYDVDFGTGSSSGYLAIAATGGAALAAQTLTGASAPGLFGFVSGTNPAPPPIAPGDFFEVDFVGQVSFSAGSGPMLLTVGLSVNGTAYAALGASALYFGPPAGGINADGANAVVRMTTAKFAAGTTRTWWDMAIMIGGGGGSSVVAAMIGAGHLTVKHYRAH